MSHWLLHFFGLDSASGPAYLLWSGALSDLGEVVLIGAVYACQVRRCWRLGRHTTAARHVVCGRHSPTGAPTHRDVIDAHQAARGRHQLHEHGG